MQKATHLANIRYDVTEGEESSAEVKRHAPWACLRVSSDDASEKSFLLVIHGGHVEQKQGRRQLEVGTTLIYSVAGKTPTITITVTTALAYFWANHDASCILLCVTF